LTGHISTDELASYRAGAVRAGRATRIAAHLAACARCAAVQSQLAGVSAMLASVPLPPMPDGLTERLQLVLADESARRTAALPVPAARARRERASWRPNVSHWSSPVMVRSLAATAVLALIVGGVLVLANLGGSGPANVAAKPAAGRQPTPHSANVLPTGTGTGYSSAGVMPVRYTYQGRFVITNVAVSDVNYTKSDLAAGIRGRLENPVSDGAATAPSPSGAESSQATSTHRSRGITAERLSGCLTKVAAGRQILQAEVALYQGAPATIVVLKPIGHIFDVIVVGATCSGTDTDVITRLRLPVTG
jgi:hypothetical protein